MTDWNPLRVFVRMGIASAVTLFGLFHLLLFPTPPAIINVAWSPNVTSTQIVDLEQRYKLEPLQRGEGTTWVYWLHDVSTYNIQALVEDIAISDTHHLDRTNYSLNEPPPSRTITNFLLALALAPLAAGACLLGWSSTPMVYANSEAARKIQRTVFRGVPWLQARTAAWLRVTYATTLAVVLIVYSHIPDGVFPSSLHNPPSFFADLSWIHGIAVDPTMRQIITVGTVVLLLLLAAGLGGRLVHLLAATGLTVHVLVELQQGSLHSWGLPLVTALGTLVIPWSKTPPLHVLLRSPNAGRGAPQKSFGFALWWPSLTIGVAFAAAAIAKLRDSGIAWITTGAVRYHFLTDAHDAKTHWGTYIAASEPASILLSAAVVVLELSFVFVVLFPGPRVRALFGVLMLGLLSGFFLLQGVFWPPWWQLLLFFLPWKLLDRENRDAPRNPHLPLAAVLVSLLLILQQTLVSGWRYEAEPFVSDFSMYSDTFTSPQEFDNTVRLHEIRFLARRNGTVTDITSELGEIGVLPFFLRVAEKATASAGPGDHTFKAALAAAHTVWKQRHRGPTDLSITVRLIERKFDWDSGLFRNSTRDAGILDLESYRLLLTDQ